MFLQTKRGMDVVYDINKYCVGYKNLEIRLSRSVYFRWRRFQAISMKGDN